MTLEGVRKCLPELENLSKLKSKRERLKQLMRAKSCLYYAISEISRNTLKGNIPISLQDKRKLNPHRKDLRLLARKSGVSLKKKKQIIQQRGGFLPALLIPALSVVASSLIDRVIPK